MLAKSLCLPDITKPGWETKLTALRSVGLATEGKAYQLKASGREGGKRRETEFREGYPHRPHSCRHTSALTPPPPLPQAPDFKARIVPTLPDCVLEICRNQHHHKPQQAPTLQPVL